MTSGEWIPPKETPLRGVKPTSPQPPPEVERILRRMTKVEGNWRAAYIEREGGGSCIVPVVMWGSFEDADKEKGDILRSGVAAMVLADATDTDELVFASERSDFLGLLAPGDMESIWDDIAKERIEAEQAGDEAQELQQLHALCGPECPAGYVETVFIPSKGPQGASTNMLDRAYNGDAALVRDHIDGKDRWFLIEARTGGVRDPDGSEPVVFELTTPERHMKGQASYTRALQRDVLGWRRSASRA